MKPVSGVSGNDDDLNEVSKYLEDMSKRVANWEELSPTLQRRIQDEARIQKTIRGAQRQGPGQDESAFLRQVDWGFVSRQPMSDLGMSNMEEGDLFRPMTTGDPGSFTSDREVQVMADKAFKWDDATLDRVERDVVDFYMEGEINA